jgi:hypothetical protein
MREERGREKRGRGKGEGKRGREKRGFCESHMLIHGSTFTYTLKPHDTK